MIWRRTHQGELQTLFVSASVLHLSLLCCCYRRFLNSMGKRVRLSDNFAVEKCQKGVCTAKDNISQLPDEILVYILSFLTVKEAADTSVLSRRWLRLWTCIPRLDFDATKALDEVASQPKLRKRQMKKYLTWVNRTLQMCEGQTLDQFRVNFDLNKFAQREIDRWLEFAFARKAQRLELDLLKGGEYHRSYDYCYTFPAQLFGISGSSTCLPHSNNLQTFPLVRQNFKYVKVLLFKSVNVTGEVLEFFLHNSLFLEQVVVHGSGTLVSMEVVGPSLRLRHLEIWYCCDLESLKICDTNLITLRTSAGACLLLKNVPMLVEVDISRPPYRYIHLLDDISCRLSCVLSQLEFLTIHAADSLFDISQENLEHYIFPELSKLKKFVITTSFGPEDQSVLGFTSIIRAAPLLEEFELQLNVWPVRSNRRCKKALKCPLHQLKVVKLCGYYTGAVHLEIVRFFLENAIALEKIIIDPRNPIPSRIPFESWEIEGQTSRNLAKLQLEGEVPLGVELVIL